MADLIKSETIWDAARKKGLKTAAILWPITCKAKINWNLPEVHVEKNQNLFLTSLRYGSFFFQLKSLLKHGRKFKGTAMGVIQPGLDDFVSAVASDLLMTKDPDLTLIHLLAYDIICHPSGIKSEALNIARKSLDNSLGRILKAAADRTVLVFSDHAHLDVNETIDLSQIYDLVEQCGGSAFLKSSPEAVEIQPWFERFLTKKEIEDSGYAGKAICGIAAKPGYCFGYTPYKSNHGYPIDYDDYRIFYAVRGKNTPPEPVFGDVRDITAIISKELGLGLSGA
jgi:hypothetical protein